MTDHNAKKAEIVPEGERKHFLTHYNRKCDCFKPSVCIKGGFIFLAFDSIFQISTIKF